MPEVRNPTRGKQNKNAIKMLNDAVNQHERGDIVLMKTLVNLNYYERMQTREKYESSYQTVTLKIIKSYSL
jgi:ribosomal protein L31E